MNWRQHILGPERFDVVEHLLTSQVITSYRLNVCV